jgi:hypothetical protein
MRMAKPPGYSGTGDEPGVAADVESTTGTPRWVKVFALIALVVVVLSVILVLTGRHGPSRHSLVGGGDPPAKVGDAVPGR